ncbi:GntR family transcriptional regulator [Candidatus Enterococcus mangumiae]|uniref:GntR family transcriptional regulator n=1 Tax=Candidatus Enterococcus mangumiae TaxID=2230878 RepID=A0ABZ2SUS5_9ENTE|nr:LacI family DNA-binding transcriptional regulator [Enterococcus sp. DIV1094]MBO0488916.1 LacI family DNA-binding transcriptional regulator [Enterococcus sp. DIV1094]
MEQPLYKTIFLALEKAINEGTLPVDSQVPTEKELSEQYNVSRITSKRALTELEQLGMIYRVRGKGSFVKAPSTKTGERISSSQKRILFLLPYLSDLSVGDFTQGLNPVMQDKQFEVMMTTLDFLEKKRADDIMQEFDGLIYYAFQTDQHLDLLFELSLQEFPVIILDKKIYELPFPTVLSDNFQGGSLATQQLIKEGHKRIAYLFGDTTHPQSVRQRYLGYLEALNLGKLSFHTTLNAQELTEDMLDTYIQQQVTAFVCENDLVAIQTMNQLKKKGYQIPNDFSVIGFDDIQAAALVDPPLTTVAQDFKQLGELAGNALIEWLATKELPKDIKYPVTLIQRQSTKEIKNEDPTD